MNIIDWLIDHLEVPQNSEHIKRTKTRLYKKRIEWVKNFWIIAGLIMLAFPHPAFVVMLCLFIIFLSFAFLDE